MRIFALGAAAAAMLTSTPANAQQWVEYAVDTVGLRSSYDASSVTRTGSVVRLWVRKDRSHVAKTPLAVESREQLEIDCAAETFTILTNVDYDAAGSVTERADGNGDAFGVAPGSTGRVLLETVCREAGG